MHRRICVCISDPFHKTVFVFVFSFHHVFVFVIDYSDMCMYLTPSMYGCVWLLHAARLPHASDSIKFYMLNVDFCPPTKSDCANFCIFEALFLGLCPSSIVIISFLQLSVEFYP